MIAVIPDIHFVENNEYHNIILSDLFNKLSSDDSISYVLFLGDVQHYKRNSLSYEMYEKYVELFKKLQKPYYGVIGNHDIILGTPNHSWITVLSNQKITNEIKVIDIEGKKILLVPFTTELDIDSLPSADVMITHLSIQPYFEQFNSSEGLTRTNIEKLKNKVKLVLSGHIHEKYIYDNFWYYCGYVLSSNFTFKPEQQYICFLDNDKVIYIPLSDYLPNTVIPRYITLEYKDFIDNADSIIEDTLNHYLIIVYDYSLYKSLLSDYYQYSHINFRIRFRKGYRDTFNLKAETQKSLFSSSTYSSILKQYTKKELDKKGIEDKELRKKIYLTGKQLLETILKERGYLNDIAKR